MGWRLLSWLWRPAPPQFVAAGAGRVVVVKPAFRTIYVPVTEDNVIRSFEPKPPEEVDAINFDYSARLAALGDSIASIGSVEVVDGPDNALELADRAHANGIVSAWWSGGTLYSRYELECIVNTTAGRKWPCRASVVIAH